MRRGSFEVFAKTLSVTAKGKLSLPVFFHASSIIPVNLIPSFLCQNLFEQEAQLLFFFRG